MAGLSAGDGTDPAGAATDLTVLCTLVEAEQQAADTAAAELEQTQLQWAELTSLLNGRTLKQLQTATRAAADAVTQATTPHDQAGDMLASAVTDLTVAQAAAQTHLSSAAELRTAQDTQTQAAATTRTEVTELAVAASAVEATRTERSRTLVSVPEAEEELAAATEDLDRIRALDATLQTTIALLSSAQERVHRDIAPLLAATLTRWLPHITDGRYTDATVNPATLQVKVCGPDRNFRPAERLSHGTAEQIYLLLRTALTQHLTAGHDSCPLLLDDVTVQADSIRTAQVLTLLHKISDERQVIVFAQQDQVAQWARENLTSERDAFVELAPVPVR